MHHAACLSATGAASCSSSGPSGIRKSLSCGNMAQLALAAQHQQHLLHHTAAPSRLRPNMPRAGSFASLNGAVSYGAETSRMQEQRTEQATSTATEASRLQKAALKSQPYASLTRVFLIGQPQNLVRGLAGRKFRAAGPVSLLLFLFGMILAIIAGVRSGEAPRAHPASRRGPTLLHSHRSCHSVLQGPGASLRYSAQQVRGERG